MEITKKQSSCSHQLKILGIITFQKLFQNKCKAGQFMLVPLFSRYFWLIKWPSAIHVPYMNHVDQVMRIGKDWNGSLSILLKALNSRLLSESLGTSITPFINHLYFYQYPLKFKTPDEIELQINFVQQVILQINFQPVRQEVQCIPGIKSSNPKWTWNLMFKFRV